MRSATPPALGAIAAAAAALALGQAPPPPPQEAAPALHALAAFLPAVTVKGVDQRGAQLELSPVFTAANHSYNITYTADVGRLRAHSSAQTPCWLATIQY